MSNLKPFVTPKSPSISSIESDNSGREECHEATGPSVQTPAINFTEHDADSNGAKSSSSISNGELREVDSNGAKSSRSISNGELREVDSNGAKSSSSISNGESSLDSMHVQRVRSSDSEKMHLLASGKLTSRKKKGLGRDEKRLKLNDILLPQKSIRLPEFKNKSPKSEYKPNTSTSMTAKFDLMSGYTEENGETVAYLSIEVEVKSDKIQEQVRKENTNLELVVRLEAYDPVKLHSLSNREKPWRYPFPQSMTQIKVMPILASQKEVDDSAENLEIRVELKVECFEYVQ